MERGFQKGDKCQKGGKKSQILHHLDELIPKPWNRKKRLVPLCFQKIQQNLQNLRCQFRRDKFSPAWNLPKRCFLVCFFGRKGWQTTNCWLFFFWGPLRKVSYMVSCKFLRSKVSQLFWFWVCLWCHEESWCRWSVGSKHAPWMCFGRPRSLECVQKAGLQKEGSHVQVGWWLSG